MIDLKNPEQSFCGKLVFKWTHRQAVEEGICNDFKIAIQIFCPKSPGSQRYLNYMEQLRLINQGDEELEEPELDDDDCQAFKEEKTEFLYGCLARVGLSTGNYHMLTFHSRSETMHNTKTHVAGFVRPAKFKKRFKEINASEFSHLQPPSKITFKGITTRTRNPRAILEDFDATGDDEVYVLSSCRTIGEGVDTKYANLELIADPSASVSTNIHRIGRITRKNKKTVRPGIVALPCAINVAILKNAKTPEVRDAVLRQEMAKFGNYQPILNVLSALKQDDPEYYDKCIKYPNNLSPEEVIDNLKEQGFKVNTPMSISDLCEKYTIDPEDPDDAYLIFQEIANKYNATVEISTQDFEDNIIEIVPEYTKPTKILRFMYNEDEAMVSEYRSKTKKTTKAPHKRSSLFSVDVDDEFKVLWDFSNDTNFNEVLTKGICNAFIESTIHIDSEEKAIAKAQEYITFYREHNRMAKRTVKDEKECKLADWLHHVKQALKGSGKCYPSVIKLLDEEIPGWNDDRGLGVALEKVSICIDFYKKHRGLPRNIEKKNRTTTEKEEAEVAQWLQCMKRASKGNRNWKLYPSVKNLLDEEIPGWNDSLEFIALEKIRKYIAFYKKYGRMPKRTKKNAEECKLANFIHGLKNALQDIGNYKCYPSVIKLLDDEIPGWRDVITTRSNKRKLVVPTNPKSSVKQRKKAHAEISVLHKTYKSLDSDTYVRKMKKSPKLFVEYHILAKKLDLCDENDDKAPNVIAGMVKKMFINITGLKKYKIVDLGCGTFSLAQALYDTFQTRINKTQLSKVVTDGLTCVDVIDARADDISTCDFATELEFIQNDIADLQDIGDDTSDVVVLSRAMWAKNYKQVLAEAWRILKQGGKIIVCEPFNRWWDVQRQSNKLLELFKEQGWDLSYSSGAELDEEDCHKIFFYAIFAKDTMKL